MAWAALGEPKCDVVATAPVGSVLDELERAFIQRFNTLSPAGLNRTLGGERGADFCSETKALMRANGVKRFSDPEERERASQRMHELYREKPELRDRLSRSQKQRYSDPKERVKTSAKLKEACAKPTAKARRSAVMLERWRDPAYRSKTLAEIASNVRRGEKCKLSKLTEVDVLKIRAARAAGDSLKTIAARHEISEPTVSEIANRRKWKHLP